MELWQTTNEWLEVVFNVLMIVLPPLIVAVGATEFGKRLLAFVIAAYKELRKLFDEPGDFLVRAVAVKTGRDPKVVSDFLTNNLDKVVALFDEN